MKVSEAMVVDVVTGNSETKVAELANMLVENEISGIPIVDSNRIILGIVTERDLLPKMKGVPFSNVRLPSLFGTWLGELEFEKVIAEAKERRAEEIMNKSVITIDKTAELSTAASLMAQHSIKRLPVVSNGVLVGIITRADIIRAIASKKVSACSK